MTVRTKATVRLSGQLWQTAAAQLLGRHAHHGFRRLDKGRPADPEALNLIGTKALHLLGDGRRAHTLHAGCQAKLTGKPDRTFQDGAVALAGPGRMDEALVDLFQV